MKILYVTRRRNRSGFYILKSLIQHDIKPEAVVLKDEFHLLDKPVLNIPIKWAYAIKCWYYRNEAVAFLESEELLARRHGICVIKTTGMKNPSFLSLLKSQNPDIIILGGGWPELIPQSVIRFPRCGVLNTHPSLLPEYRGTSITRWQVLHGESKTGVTIHFVDEQFDTGDILMQRSLKIGENETPQGLFDRLSHLAADMMVELIKSIKSEDFSNVPRIPQDRQKGQYFSRWSWDLDNLIIDWLKSFQDIHNFIRSNNQESYEYPGPIFRIGNEVFIARKSWLSRAPSTSLHESECPNPRISKIDDSGWHIKKSGDPHILHISLVQRYKRWRWRRAVNPSTLKFIKHGDILKNCTGNFSLKLGR